MVQEATLTAIQPHPSGIRTLGSLISSGQLLDDRVVAFVRLWRVGIAQ